jgi:hypothetical protein
VNGYSEEKDDSNVLTVEAAMHNLPASLEYQTTPLPDLVDINEIMEVATLALPLQAAFASHTRIWRHYFHKKPECKVTQHINTSTDDCCVLFGAYVVLLYNQYRKSSKIAFGGVCASFLVVPWHIVHYVQHIDH